MRLTLHTDYSLRTLMYLAARPGRQTVQGVAEFFQISEAHVGKVVNQLARLGYVRSIRGIGGGLELARSPDQITIGQVVQSVEGSMHLLECVGVENVCVIQQHCKLRTVLDRAERIQMDYLNSVTLADILPFGPRKTDLKPASDRPGDSRSPANSGIRASRKRSKRQGESGTK